MQDLCKDNTSHHEVDEADPAVILELAGRGVPLITSFDRRPL
ncbi:hypothetical protein [Rhodococcoides fascians]|jgi:hypothetical protein|nr:hypothetical protein [Rhodococcus fascians]